MRRSGISVSRGSRAHGWRIAAAAFGALLVAHLSFAESPPPGAGSYVASGSKVNATIFNQFAGEDVDQYIFEGFAGQTVTVSVKAGKARSLANDAQNQPLPPEALLPSLDLIGPDGVTISTADGAKFTPKRVPPKAPGKTQKVVFKLNQTGTWTVRVRGSYPGVVRKGDNPATPEVETNFVYVDFDFDGPDDVQNSGDEPSRTRGDYTLQVKTGGIPPAQWKNAIADEDGLFRFIAPAAGGSTLTSTLTFKTGTPTLVSVTAPNGRTLEGIPAVTVPLKKISITKYVVPRSYPAGGYLFTFRDGTPGATKVNFKSSVKAAVVEKALKSKLAQQEPTIDDVIPNEGGPNVPVTIRCSYLNDAAGEAPPRVFLGRIEVANVTADATNSILTFTTPVDLPDGTFDVRVVSTSGQAAVRVNGFRVVPPPQAYTLEPTVGSAAGGFTVKITGANFSTVVNGMKVGFKDLQTGGSPITPPVTFLKSTATELWFTMPNLFPAREYEVSVINARTGRSAILPMRLTLAVNAAINRVVPGLVPVLGGEQMYINGSNFAATNKVFIETSPGSGQPDLTTGWEEITATQTTYLNPGQHTFVAPARAKGVYRVFVRDENDYSTPTRTFAYYQFQNFTSNLALTGTDPADGYTTALADYDNDGDDDLFVSRIGNATTKANSSQTRLFRNDGTGALTDVTASVMPPVSSDDDWRADRIRVIDIDLRVESGGKAYPDVVICTDSDKFPTTAPNSGAKSHVRILINEKNASTGDRIFRDRTQDLMAPPRSMTVLYGGGGKNETDDWRGKDLWVGDVDLSNAGPPEIVTTTDRVFENYYVSCTPYCASPYSGGYTYSFYWGGTRLFKWDQSARSGLGRYKYDASYFPRIGGITVPIFNPPPGTTIPTCQPNQCRGMFVPFTGQRLAVGDVNADGRPDFAVLSNQNVMANSAQVSSLQFAINKFYSGFQVWDQTADLTGLAGTSYFKGETVAIGHTGYKDTDGYGVIAIARADPTGLTGTAMRLIRVKPTLDEEDICDFEMIDESLPPWTVDDRLHASAIEFVDVDDDGDEDMVSVARTPPGGGSGAAFRIFRNEVENQLAGNMKRTLDGLISNLVTPSEQFAGIALSIGDLDADGANEYVITRDGTSGGTAPHSRAIRTDK